MNSNLLENVPDQHKFLVCDGTTLKNIKELHEAMHKMGDHIYSYHANEQKNDFAKWVNDIVKDNQLAENLRNAKSKNMAVGELGKAIGKATKRKKK